MSLKRMFFCLLSLSLFLNACKKDDDNPGGDELDIELETALTAVAYGQGLSFVKMPESTNLAAIPQDAKNPLTAEKVSLGKMLYHETGLALAPKEDISKNTYSCASCHFASAGFQAGRHQGISEGGIGFGVNGEGRIANSMYDPDSLDVQPIRTPTAMNGAYQEVMLWNGQFGSTGVNEGTDAAWYSGKPKEANNLGYEGLETQAIAGLKVHRQLINEQVLEDLGYKPIFDMVFPDVTPADRYTREYAGLAIAAYERTLLSNKAPFQEWLGGNTSAMTEQQKRGAVVFFNEGNCGSCHTGPALNSMTFHGLGMKDLFECVEETFQSHVDKGENKGRGGFTENADDNYKFKVPQLYNMNDSPFLGHGSSMRSIREVVEYKNMAVPENPRVPASQLAAQFVPLSLTDAQIDDLTAFLAEALHDNELSRYEPESLLSGNCFPNNDMVSRADLGCD